jgi:uncharacterized membrane protein
VKDRIAPIDLLRGLVIVIMALDHTREYVHCPAMLFPPEDLARTTAATFLTRWVTHICAPVFMFCAGLGAFLWQDRHGGTTLVSRFLVTRGLWLILLEVTVVRLGFFFNVDYSLVFLLVFWALGMSMIALAALVHLPYRVLAAVSIGMIVLHHLADGVRAASFGGAAWIWNLLHQPGLIQTPGPTLLAAYPLIPWIGVMSAGYCGGRIYRLPADRRARLLVRLGLLLTGAFIVLRGLNAYGDPRPWASQTSVVFTILSFINTTKYPPSLLFLLMTLGPAITLLGWMDGARPSARNPILVFGRVPLFFFVLHIPLIHAIARLMNWTRYGSQPFVYMPPPTMGTPRNLFPDDYGWSLAVTYAVWLAVVAVLYPACRWFARVRARQAGWWAGYL